MRPVQARASAAQAATTVGTMRRCGTTSASASAARRLRSRRTTEARRWAGLGESFRSGDPLLQGPPVGALERRREVAEREHLQAGARVAVRLAGVERVDLTVEVRVTLDLGVELLVGLAGAA